MPTDDPTDDPGLTQADAETDTQADAETDVPTEAPQPAEADVPAVPVEADAAGAEPAEPVATEPVAPVPATPSGRGPWSVLRSLVSPRLNASQVIVGVLCAALGFALIVQVRQNQTDNLSSLQQSDLVRLLDDVTQRNQALQREYSSLQSTRDRLEAGSGSRQAAVDLANQRAETQGILSGRLPAQGPGVTLVITEGTQPVGAATMFNVLEELRNAGAEAVQVNGVRLVASSYFEMRDGGLVSDDVPLSSPYTWVAIGDPKTLAPALGIPGGALAAVRNTGATADLSESQQVKVVATREPTQPRFATPAPAPTGG